MGKFEGVRSKEYNSKVVGINLKIARKRMGLRQDEAARLIGTTGRTLGSYERAEVEIPLARAVQLMQLYHISLKELTGMI